MYCTNCQKEIAENAKFCTSCGTPVQAPVQQAAPTPNAAPGYQPMPGVAPQILNNFYVAPKAPVSVGGWIGRSLIPLIPIVGPLVYLIMLFIWAGDNTKETSFTNWAKAQLVVMLIGIVLAVFLFIVLGLAIGSIF